jgi:hypothetical protein
VQVSPVQHSAYYTPVQPAAPVKPVGKGDGDADSDGGKPKAANPPGVGALLDISA